jgi:hypothetical protein
LGSGGSCLGSLTAEASCARRKNTPKAAAPSAASRTLPSTTAGLFFIVASAAKIDCVRPLYGLYRLRTQAKNGGRRCA